MTDPIAVIIRFTGDPDDLLDRFERARQLWIEEQDSDYARPAFYAVASTDEGIAVITGWESDAAHIAFAHGMGRHLAAVGLRQPDHHHEHLQLRKLGRD